MAIGDIPVTPRRHVEPWHPASRRIARCQPDQASSAVIGLILSPFVVVMVAPWLVGRCPRRAALLAGWPAALAVLLAVEMRHAPPEAGDSSTCHGRRRSASAAVIQSRRPGAAVRDVDNRHRAVIVLYAEPLPRGRPSVGPLRCLTVRLHGGDARRRSQREHPDAVRCWELTGFTSYLLIGFDDERTAARRAALQALVVTGAGGVALLAVGLLSRTSRHDEPSSAMAVETSLIRPSEPFYGAIASLMLLAAFTKSAQVPFHFWLRTRWRRRHRSAPTSTSATMVKAGVVPHCQDDPGRWRDDAVDDGRDGGGRDDHGRRRVSQRRGEIRPQAHPRDLALSALAY